MLYVFGFVGGMVVLAFLALIPFFLLLVSGESLLRVCASGRGLRFLLIMFKNLRRNLLRTSLTYLATFVLVVIFTMIWSVLYWLDNFSKEKAKPPKLIVQEKWQANSQLPFHYAASLEEGASRRRPGDVKPQDAMTWQFYIGTVDPAKQTRESLVPCIAMEPRKCLGIMDDLWDDFTTDEGKNLQRRGTDYKKRLAECVEKLEHAKNGIVMSTLLMQTLDKKMNERLTLTGVNYKDLNLEFEIVAEFPHGRFTGLAVINRDYLNDSISNYEKTHNGIKHPLADRSLNMVWLQVREKGDIGRVVEQIDTSGLYQAPAVKCETLAAGMAAFMDSYRDLIWGMRWLLSPAILFTMTLVLANAISISVRERRSELAVLKVLGFHPGQILALVLGEATLIGAVSGGLSAVITFVMVNLVLNNNGSFELGILVPLWGLAWGPVIGAATALGGSFIPAWTSCRIKVSEVFAKVA